MKTIESEAFRIGGTFSRGILVAIETFLKTMAKPEFKGYKPKEIAEQINQSFAYVDPNTFYQEQVSKGKNEFDSAGLNANHFEKFENLASQYAMKYLYEEKPSNLEDLLDKKNPTKDEERIINTWTIVQNDTAIPINDDFKITFAVKDLPKMECIVKDLKSYVDKDLDSRIEKAIKKKQLEQEKPRTRTKKRVVEKEKEGR